MQRSSRQMARKFGNTHPQHGKIKQKQEDIDMSKEPAKLYVRLSSQITQEVNDKLVELMEILGTTKTAIIEQAIIRLYEEKKG